MNLFSPIEAFYIKMASCSSDLLDLYPELSERSLINLLNPDTENECSENNPPNLSHTSPSTRKICSSSSSDNDAGFEECNHKFSNNHVCYLNCTYFSVILQSKTPIVRHRPVLSAKQLLIF